MSQNIGSSSERRLIIGIDYGTTFSGCTFVISNKIIDDIEVLNVWPGNFVGTRKIPSRISYALENYGILSNKCGYEVNSKLISYPWTKLLLDKHALPGDFDNLALSEIFSEGWMELPFHRDAQGVCQDYLHELHKQLMSYLKKKMGVPVFESMPMYCVLTLPAVWSEEAKNSTLEAAKTAGFASRPQDRITTISESEAGAVAVLKAYIRTGALNMLKGN